MAKVARDSCLIKFREDELHLLIQGLTYVEAGPDIDALREKLMKARTASQYRDEASKIERDLSS